MSVTIKRSNRTVKPTDIYDLKVGAIFQVSDRDTPDSHLVFVRVKDGAIALGADEQRTLVAWDAVEEIDVEIVVKD